MRGRPGTEVADYIDLVLQHPTHPEANQIVGSYYCLVKQRWEDGLPLLARAADPRLAELAALELKPPDAPSEQLALADRWWMYAEGEAKHKLASAPSGLLVPASPQRPAAGTGTHQSRNAAGQGRIQGPRRAGDGNPVGWISRSVRIWWFRERSEDGTRSGSDADQPLWPQFGTAAHKGQSRKDNLPMAHRRVTLPGDSHRLSVRQSLSGAQTAGGRPRLVYAVRRVLAGSRVAFGPAGCRRRPGGQRTKRSVEGNRRPGKKSRTLGPQASCPTTCRARTATVRSAPPPMDRRGGDCRRRQCAGRGRRCGRVSPLGNVRDWYSKRACFRVGRFRGAVAVRADGEIFHRDSEDAAFVYVRGRFLCRRDVRRRRVHGFAGRRADHGTARRHHVLPATRVPRRCLGGGPVRNPPGPPSGQAGHLRIRRRSETKIVQPLVPGRQSLVRRCVDRRLF